MAFFIALSRAFLTVALGGFFVVVAVSASVTEDILQVPLLGFRELWLRTTSSVFDRVASLGSLTDMCPPTCFTFALLATVCGFVYVLHFIFFVPLNRMRRLEDVGFIPEGQFTRKEVANVVMKRRGVGDMPPVYPNGWFGLIESFQIKAGEVKDMYVLGLNLAVFRDEEGVIHAVDAYCPHLGANIAVGGQVQGSCIQCPFHGWKFRGDDGKCMHIPNSETVPEFAKIKSWPVMELNGWVYLWHHVEGAEPTWTLPEMEEITKGEWTYRGRTEHIVSAHIQEIPENGADVAHLAYVHTSFIGAGTNLRHMWSKLWGFAVHKWTANWESFPPPLGHVGQLSLTHGVDFFGIRVPFLDMKVKAKQIGPGVVYLELSSMFGNGVFIHNVLPIGPMMQRVVHNIYVKRTMPTFIAKFYMLGEAIQVERDIMIWNNKRYAAKPILVKSREDTLIAKHRRWYSQFYSEHSPRFSFTKDTLDW